MWVKINTELEEHVGTGNGIFQKRKKQQQRVL